MQSFRLRECPMLIWGNKEDVEMRNQNINLKFHRDTKERVAKHAFVIWNTAFSKPMQSAVGPAQQWIKIMATRHAPLMRWLRRVIQWEEEWGRMLSPFGIGVVLFSGAVDGWVDELADVALPALGSFAPRLTLPTCHFSEGDCLAARVVDFLPDNEGLRAEDRPMVQCDFGWRNEVRSVKMSAILECWIAVVLFTSHATFEYRVIRVIMFGGTTFWGH